MDQLSSRAVLTLHPLLKPLQANKGGGCREAFQVASTLFTENCGCPFDAQAWT